jgi:hypothetical protein
VKFTTDEVAAVARDVPLQLGEGDAEPLQEVLAGVAPLLETVDALPCSPADDPFSFVAVLRRSR